MKAGIKGLGNFKRNSAKAMRVWKTELIRDLKSLAKLVSETMVRKTPILTGSARYSIVANVGEPVKITHKQYKSAVRGNAEREEKRTKVAINRNDRNIGKWKLDEVLYISSYIPYIDKLDIKHNIKIHGEQAFILNLTNVLKGVRQKVENAWKGSKLK